MYSMMTTVNHIVVYVGKVARRVNLKSSHHTQTKILYA